jgi:hypothetical protein
MELDGIVAMYATTGTASMKRFAIERSSKRQQHEEELERFDAASPFDFEPAFRKRSPRLLQLQTKQTRLMLTNRFDEAEQVVSRTYRTLERLERSADTVPGDASKDAVHAQQETRRILSENVQAQRGSRESTP